MLVKSLFKRDFNLIELSRIIAILCNPKAKHYPSCIKWCIVSTRTVLASGETRKKTNSLNKEQQVEANYRVLFCVSHFLNASSEFNIFVSNSTPFKLGINGFQRPERSIKVLFLVCFLCLCFLSILACSWFSKCTIFLVLKCDKLYLWLMW